MEKVALGAEMMQEVLMQPTEEAFENFLRDLALFSLDSDKGSAGGVCQYSVHVCPLLSQ